MDKRKRKLICSKQKGLREQEREREMVYNNKKNYMLGNMLENMLENMLGYIQQQQIQRKLLKDNDNKYDYDGGSKADPTECGKLDDNKYRFGGIEKVCLNEMI